jgi:hypothetical protein
MRSFIVSALPVLLALSGCGEAVRDDHFANEVAGAEANAPAPVVTDGVPVRIGELGPNFAACGGAGTTRNLAAGAVLPVRAAPFDSAEEIGGIAAGSRFYVCARSHDQRWMGVVYDEGGALAEQCGVSAPVTTRRPYEGPCRSGWVASAFVKLVAG